MCFEMLGNYDQDMFTKIQMAFKNTTKFIYANNICTEERFDFLFV